jgi:hypothetical protein
MGHESSACIKHQASFLKNEQICTATSDSSTPTPTPFLHLPSLPPPHHSNPVPPPPHHPHSHTSPPARMPVRGDGTRMRGLHLLNSMRPEACRHSTATRQVSQFTASDHLTSWPASKSSGALVDGLPGALGWGALEGAAGGSPELLFQPPPLRVLRLLPAPSEQ